MLLAVFARIENKLARKKLSTF